MKFLLPYRQGQLVFDFPLIVRGIKVLMFIGDVCCWFLKYLLNHIYTLKVNWFLLMCKMGLFSLFSKSSNLFYPGCMMFLRFHEGFKLYSEIFGKLSIEFRVFDDYICCGLRALEAGYENEVWKLARRNFDILKKEGVRKILTTSPECYYMFLKKYPDIILYWDIETENIWELILSKLERKPGLIKNKAMEVVAFHDNCYLGRGCGVYEPQRRILELIGYEIKELPNSRENSFCCGSCGGLVRSNPRLADKIAKERILQAKRIGIDKIIVIGFDNYEILNRNVGDTGVEVTELSRVLGIALGLKVEGFGEEFLDEEGQIFAEVEANKRLREELNEEDFYDEYQEDRL